MTINELAQTNLQRCAHWLEQGLEDGTAPEWAGLMQSDARESVSLVKRLRSLESHFASTDKDEYHSAPLDDARRAVAKKVVDTLLYGLLLMSSVGIDDPEKIICEVFNEKSEEYGLAEKL